MTFRQLKTYRTAKTKAGYSAYVVKGGYLYVAVPTAAGIDLKQLRVGKGSRGLPGKVGPRGDVGPAGPQGIKVHKESKEHQEEMVLIARMGLTARMEGMVLMAEMPMPYVKTARMELMG